MLQVTRQRSRRSMVGTARCAGRVPLCNVKWPFADAAARRPYQFFSITLKICIHSSRHPRTKNNAPRFQNPRNDVSVVASLSRSRPARRNEVTPPRSKRVANVSSIAMAATRNEVMLNLQLRGHSSGSCRIQDDRTALNQEPRTGGTCFRTSVFLQRRRVFRTCGSTSLRANALCSFELALIPFAEIVEHAHGATTRHSGIHPVGAA